MERGLHRQIRLGVPQFLLEGDGLCGGDGGEVGLEVGGEIIDDLHRLLRRLPAQLIDGNQCIEDKVRAYLVHHGPDFFVPEFLFLLPKQTLPENSRPDEAHAPHEQIPHDPDQKNRSLSHGTGNKEDQQVRPQGQEEGQQPQELRTAGLLSQERDHMKDRHADAVPDENVMQLRHAGDLEQQKGDSRPGGSIEAQKPRPAFPFGKEDRHQPQGQHQHQEIAHRAGEPDLLLQAPIFQEQRQHRQAAELPDPRRCRHRAEVEDPLPVPPVQRKGQGDKGEKQPRTDSDSAQDQHEAVPGQLQHGQLGIPGNHHEGGFLIPDALIDRRQGDMDCFPGEGRAHGDAHPIVARRFSNVGRVPFREVVFQRAVLDRILRNGVPEIEGKPGSGGGGGLRIRQGEGIRAPDPGVVGDGLLSDGFRLKDKKGGDRVGMPDKTGIPMDQRHQQDAQQHCDRCRRFGGLSFSPLHSLSLLTGNRRLSISRRSFSGVSGLRM